jgi:preprotein translocase subunit SecY
LIRSVSALNNIWKIPDLKKKVLYTLLILLVYRIGAHIPTPFIDRVELAKFIENSRQGLGGSLFAVVDLFSGNAFRQMSVLALGIMPYISVSIILQLLAVVYPKLQKLQQEGALGQRKINRMTRQFTVILALFQSLAMGIYLQTNHLTYMRDGSSYYLFLFTTIIAMTAGTTFLMWLGERITDDGIGNGISLIIAVGIMASYPGDVISIVGQINQGAVAPIWGVLTVILFVISSVSIILIQDGTRRIPMQAARPVVGRRQMGSGTNYLPLKVNTAGVIPVIFASAILAFPSFLSQVMPGNGQTGAGAAIANFFSINSTSNLYAALGLKMEGIFSVLKAFNAHIIVFALLTGFFCYFYTAVTFNPDDIANNLKKSGSFIPGKRPGRPTSEYIDYVLTRVTTFGALFLVAIAILPMILQVSYGMPFQASAFVGGTGLIIVIGVLLDTLKQIESQLLMRHYEGFAARRTSSRWR